MPTITTQARAAIGSGPEDFRMPHKTITQPTGMNLPKIEKPIPAPLDPSEPQKTGQLGISEETPAKAVTLSPQLTALARRQQKLQAEIQAQREKETEWEKQKAEYVPRSGFKAKLQQNAAEALKEFGTDYEELTRLLLEQQNGADPVKALASEVEQLKKAQEDGVNKQFEAIVSQYKAEAKTLVSKEAEKFAFIQANPEWIDGAVQYIVDEWEADNNNVISLEDALALTEDSLRIEAKKQADILAKIEGTKKPDPAPEKTLPPPRSGARTLTEKVEAAPTRTYNQFQHMSMKERIAQAVARAQR